MSKYKQLLHDLNYIDDVDDNNLVQNLLTAPRKDKSFEATHTICPTENYLLVCVDIATSMCDAEPIKYKYHFIVRDALKRIYARKILKISHEIEVDAGNEFKSDFSTYFNTVSKVRRKKAGRDRAQAVVEGMNSLLSKIVQTRMISGVEEIPGIIKVVNKYFYRKPPQTDYKNHDPIKVKKGSLASNILPEGTAVRIQLDDYPTTSANSDKQN